MLTKRLFNVPSNEPESDCDPVRKQHAKNECISNSSPHISLIDKVMLQNQALANSWEITVYDLHFHL